MQPITDELIQEIKNRIISEVHPEKIILFGSYAYGTPTKDSDLDLLIILPVEKWKNASAAFITSIIRKGKVIYG